MSASMGLDEGWAALMSWHRAHGSRVPDVLRPGASAEQLSGAEAQLGFTLHDEVRRLLGICDGIDVPQVARTHQAIAQIVPRIEFPGLADSLTWHDELAAEAAAGRAEGDDPPWQHSWFPIFTIGGGEVVAVDCASSGLVLHVSWEERSALSVAPTLGAWLALAAERLDRAEVELFRALTPRITAPGCEPSYFLQPVADD